MSATQLRDLRKKLSAPEAVKAFRAIRAAAGSSRLKILYALRGVKDGLTITDISKLLNASLSRVSHQMRILKKAGLVSAEKEGRNVFYRGNSAAVAKCVVLPR